MQGNYENQRGSGSADNTIVVLKNCFHSHISSSEGCEGHGQILQPKATHVNYILDREQSCSSFPGLV